MPTNQTPKTLGTTGHPVSTKGFLLVGATGFEPVTPAVSRQCSAAELSAQVSNSRKDSGRGGHTPAVEATPGIEPGFRVLQTLA